MVNAPDVSAACSACALSGAAAVFAGIPQTKIVIHGPAWCYYFVRQHLEREVPHIDTILFSSQVAETDIVYGAEACLQAALRRVCTADPPEMVAILNTCAVSLIGEDSVGAAAQVGVSCPLVVMDAGGISGGFWQGYQQALQRLFQEIALPPEPEQAYCLNVLGASCGYYQGMSDMQEVCRLLQLAGYRVLACPGAGSTLDELRRMRQAACNLVLHAELGRPLAEWLYQQYGIPYLVLPPPYGLNGTQQWGREVAQALGKRPEWAAYEQEVSQWQQRQERGIRELERMWGSLWFAKVAVAAPSSVAIGLAHMLRTELLDADCLEVLLHDAGQGEADLRFNTIDAVHNAATQSGVAPLLNGLQNGLLLSSNYEWSMLQKQEKGECVWVPASLPVWNQLSLQARPLMGLHGAMLLAEQIWNEGIRLRERTAWRR